MSEAATWAPIALFIHRRPDHARRTIESLLACEGVDASPIHVYADGPRSPGDHEAVHATRAVARALLGPRAIFREQEHNLGLADSIIAGVTELCDQYDEVIAVEDDLVLAPSFLAFLNAGLRRYRTEPRVMQVSGHMFDVPGLRDANEAVLLPMTTSWGWATWKRAWDLFDPAATGWQARLASAEAARRFDLDGHYGYRRMLERQMRGEIDSWAIRWYYALFARAGLALFPPRTLVTNVGMDGSGTHGRAAIAARQAGLAPVPSFTMPTDIAASPRSPEVYAAIKDARPTGSRAVLRGLANRSARAARGVLLRVQPGSGPW